MSKWAWKSSTRNLRNFVCVFKYIFDKHGIEFGPEKF